MKIEDLNLMAQLVESMISLADGLEKAMEKKDLEKIKKLKTEILKFHQESDKILSQN